VLGAGGVANQYQIGSSLGFLSCPWLTSITETTAQNHCCASSLGPVIAVASWQGNLALAISGMVARIGKAQHPHFAAAYGKISRLRKEASVCSKDDERVEFLIGILTSGQMSADLAITSSQHPVSATLSLARTLWP